VRKERKGGKRDTRGIYITNYVEARVARERVSDVFDGRGASRGRWTG